MSFEEGEIQEIEPTSLPFTPTPTQTGTGTEEYDPSYEWPGDSAGDSSPAGEFLDEAPPTNKLRPSQPAFRLIVLETSILPRKQKLGLLDGFSEVQFGRDVAPIGSTTPKIRLKEMPVSKLHATAYWDAIRREWNIVDMGSMHGTFLQSDYAPGAGDGPGARLSASRQASLPRKLKHMDKLTIGGTSFLIHMHEDQFPCEECCSDGNDEIPLFPVAKSGTQGSSKAPEVWPMPTYTPKTSTNPKKALTLLRQSLLGRQNAPVRPESTPPAVQPYVDRSARRRALMPSSSSDAPGISATQFSKSEPPSRPRSPIREPESQPAKPLPKSNFGHRLLMKQGWAPGTALGNSPEEEGRIGLVEPLELTTTSHRAGLGMKRAADTTVTASGSDWKEQAKRRRWDNVG